MDHAFDVAIIGFGPTGGVLANLLGQAGVRVVVVERNAEVVQQPRAAHFDGEVMRVFQGIGLADEVKAIARAGIVGMHFVNAQGEVLMVREASDRPGLHGHMNSWYFHQPDLERVLCDGAARFPGVTILAGHEVAEVTQADDRVEMDVVQPDGRRRAIAAKYVVGCDGARSTVRKRIGSGREDLGLHQPWLCLDLRMQRDVGLPGHSVQVCDPRRPMTLVNMSGNRRRWEIMLMPGDDPQAIASPERAWQFLAPWVTPADATIERCAVYTFHSVIARGWRRGRLFIAGDAAHQTPPFLGQGMCAGIRDAANLAWKLALVCESRAPDTLLDTYESERSPHVREFIDLAVRVGAIIQATDPQVVEARDRRFRDHGKEVFAFPTPCLGPGLHDDAPRPVATPCPQFIRQDGTLLDDDLGSGFALFVDATLATQADTWRRRLPFESAIIAGDADERVARWLREHDAVAAILRPDRYVFGLARSAPALDRLLTNLRDATVQSPQA